MCRVPLQGGKHRFAGQYDPENGNGKSTWVGDIWGDGRLRLQAQVVDARADNKTEWGFTARLRGEDYVAVARVKDSPEVGVSYNQRLCPGSPITLGGEMFLNIASLRAVGKAGGKGDKGPAAPPKRPMDWAIGAAYDAGGHKVRTPCTLHLAPAAVTHPPLAPTSSALAAADCGALVHCLPICGRAQCAPLVPHH